MNDYEHKQLEDFFKAIELSLPGYQHTNFSYLATKNGNAFELRLGRLNVLGVPARNSLGYFESANVKAGSFCLKDLKRTIRDFVGDLLSGVVRTPHGSLLFPAEEGRIHTLYFAPFHSDGISTQRRQMQLTIGGARRNQLQSNPFDWELKAAVPPFFNLQELCDEYQIGALKADSLNVEIIAFNIAAISAESSVQSTKAYLSLDLAEGLLKENASIGFRVSEKNKVTRRGSIPGTI